MRYILDTCTYFWLVDDQSKLSGAALSAISDANNSLHLSAITVTEIHRLVRKGKISIHAPNGLEEWFQKGLAQHGVICEPITLAIAHAAEMLPRFTTIPPTASFSPRPRVSVGESSRRIRSCRGIPALRPSGDADVAQVSNLLT